MSFLLTLLKISRPRFWVYVFGPYLVGLAAAAASANDLLRPGSIVFGLYFLFPAN
ncbi:MAG TPA: lycopene elongase, partial [Blastocatellia bacterium]|nr:lycopene elongase [Blastocatellia bacterium]